MPKTNTELLSDVIAEIRGYSNLGHRSSGKAFDSAYLKLLKRKRELTALIEKEKQG